MAKKKKNPFGRKLVLVEILNGAFEDLRGQSRYAKGTLLDLRRGRAYPLARPIRSILALVATVGLVFLVFFFVFGKEDRIKAHLEKADTSLAARDYDNAILQYEKAFKLSDIDDPSTYLNYIDALLGKGDDKKTRKVLNQLAPGPGNSPGLKEIHRMIAVSHSDKLSNSQDTNSKSFKWHLDHSGEVDSKELNIAWAQYYLAMGEPEEAVSFFEVAADDDPKFFEQVIAIHGMLGQEKLKAIAARKAKPKIEKLVELNRKDDSSRVLLSRILFHLGKENESEQVLQTGLEQTDSRSLKDAYASFYVASYRRHAKSNTFSTNLDLLRKAFLLGPEIDGHSMEFYKLAQSTKTPEEKAAVVRVLEEATQNPEQAVTAHTLLASIFWNDDRKAEAREHAEKAHEMDPTSPVTANNFAFFLCESENPDLSRARKLALFAVERFPKNAEFRDTLGIVLMKMNQYQEAMVEFEKALAFNVADAESVHKKLSICYDKLGFKMLSERHAAESKRPR